MEQQRALSILIEAATVAQKRGAFDLKEAKLIAEAVEVFTKTPGQEKAPEVTPETPKEEVKEEDKEEPKEEGK